MTLEYIHSRRFKYDTYFDNEPNEGFYVVLNVNAVFVCEVIFTNWNGITVKSIQNLKGNFKNPIHFSRDRIAKVTRHNLKFVNKYGFFKLPKHHFPEYYL